jgi:hypothetical protein
MKDSLGFFRHKDPKRKIQPFTAVAFLKNLLSLSRSPRARPKIQTD